MMNDLIEIDAESGRVLRRFPNEMDPGQMAFSADGRWIVGHVHSPNRPHSFGGTSLVLLDRASLAVVRKWCPAGMETPLDQISSDPDTDEAEDEPDSPFDSWSLGTIAFSPDSRRVAWSRAGKRHCVEIADVATGRVLSRISFTSACRAIEFSSDGRQLATGHHDTTISLWGLPDASQ
jgi:WD40 repeat protein